MTDNKPENEPGVELGGAVRSLCGGQFIYNRYSLVRLLGRGRTSAVWQAWDDQQSQDVALKFLPESLAQNAEVIADLQETVRRLTPIDVPQVARVLGFEKEGKFAAVVMQMVDGTSLAAMREQKKDQVFEAVELKEWLKKITHILGDLHQNAGVCHGNLKPSNLLVGQDGALMIAGLGIDAKIGNWVNRLEGSPRDVSETLRYVSPQQSKAGEPAITDDTYGLGAALYDLITGNPPFFQGNIQAQVAEDVPPSMTRRRRDLRIVGEPIPRAWDETVAACLEKESEKRPQSMRQLAEMLELYGPAKVTIPVLSEADVEAAIAAAPKPEVPELAAIRATVAPPESQQPAGKKNLVPLVAVVVGVVLGVAGWYVSTLNPDNPPPNLARNPGSASTNGNTPTAEEIERQRKLEEEEAKIEAERQSIEVEKRQMEEEKRRLEEEEAKRKAAVAATLAAAEKARLEAEAAQKAAQEEAARKAAEAEVKRLAAEEDARRLAAEREAIRKKEEELKAAQAKAVESEATKRAEADAARLKLEEELAAKKAEEVRLRAAAEQARLEAEATKAAAAAATKELEEQERLRKESDAKAQAAMEEERLRREAEAARKAELERKLAELEKERKLAEAERQRKLEEAARRADLEREQRMASLSSDARKEAEARRLAEEKARLKLAAQSQLVGNRPVPGAVWHNSLGMRMAPFGDIFVCAWETRVQDFEAFERDSSYRAGMAWKNPGFKQSATHPVVQVSYDDAQAFCNWLTAKERKEGILEQDQIYRLPTDSEWSRMASLENESGTTPLERSGRIRRVYPWGTDWPPPPGVGNYAASVSFDQFEGTAPVASFRPNVLGIFDLGGNVWEWCQDSADGGGSSSRVLRGGSWFGYVPGTLLSSFRLTLLGSERRADNGFRVVLAR